MAGRAQSGHLPEEDDLDDEEGEDEIPDPDVEEVLLADRYDEEATDDPAEMEMWHCCAQMIQTLLKATTSSSSALQWATAGR